MCVCGFFVFENMTGSLLLLLPLNAKHDLFKSIYVYTVAIVCYEVTFVGWDLILSFQENHV